MAKKKKDTVPPEIIARYKKVVESIPNLELKGATMPYTSHNGHMFSFLDKTGKLSLRLPETEREVFMKKFNTSQTEAHGTILKEYVDVPEKLFEDINTLKKYLKESLKYVSSLKPKPAK
jgi:hypothetical protein